MKKYLLLLCLCLCTGGLLYAQGIKFETGSLEKVLSKARQQQKYVFVDCYTVWCGPCKLMAKNVFTDAGVADYFNATFINYKLDMEKGEGKTVSQRYRVSAFPTFLFLDGEGNLVYRAVGMKKPEEFIRLAKEVFNDRNVIKQGLLFDQHIQDSAFVARYLYQLEEARMTEELYGATNKYLEAVSPASYLRPYYWELIRKYVTDYRSPVIGYVVKNATRFYEVYGKNEVVDCVAESYWTRYRELSQQENLPNGEIEQFITEVKNLKMPFIPPLLARLYLLKYNNLSDREMLAETIDDLFTYGFLTGDIGDPDAEIMIVMEIGVYAKTLTQGGHEDYNEDIVKWFTALSAINPALEYQIACISTLYEAIKLSGDRQLQATWQEKKDVLMKTYYRQNLPTKASLEATKTMMDAGQYNRMLEEIKRLGVKIQD